MALRTKTPVGAQRKAEVGAVDLLFHAHRLLEPFLGLGGSGVPWSSLPLGPPD